MNKSFYKNSTKTAIGGIIAALSIVLMLLTSAIPTLTYAIPAIAGLLLVIIVIEVNKKWAFGVYFVVACSRCCLLPIKRRPLCM